MQYNRFLVLLLGEFNVKSSNWCKNDITTIEGEAIENISSQFGLHQVINEPKHILQSSSPSFDLIFPSLPKLITEQVSIRLYIVILITRSFFEKFNLEILYRPPYFRDVWH